MDEFEKLDLEKITINIDDLLLDPDNPRFSKHPSEYVSEDRYDDSDVQEQTFIAMQGKKFEIKELMDSIRSKGFVPVDNIFVKKVKGKYLVVEGNRRITAVKVLLKLHDDGKKKDRLSKEILETLNEIECFDLTKNTDDEIDFILGLRHHGSIKIWDFLPSAYNLYKRYMKELGGDDPEKFYYDAQIAKKIKNLYSIRLAEVRNKLRAYRAYLQLVDAGDGIEIDDKKFSIIHDAIADKKARAWLGFDEYNCNFSDEGADTFIDLVFGNPEQGPVITAASAGESNLRDFIYVLKNGNDADIDRIVKERESASAVKADVKSKVTERTLLRSLEEALSELEKIQIKEDFQGLGVAEKETLDEIKKIIKKIDKLAAR